MVTVFQWFDDQGNLTREERDERPNRTSPSRPYGSTRRVAEAHRVIVDGYVVKDNGRGPR